MRRQTKQITIGNIKIGGDAPISVQSMCNTDTRDIKATLKQINELHEKGCEIVRLAVLNKDAAAAIKDIAKLSPVALVADIHFDYRLAIECINNGIQGLRLNPGNIGKRENVEKVVKLAKQQKQYAENGISTAIVNGKLVTVGDFDRNYNDWKHFIVSQIFNMGIVNFLNLTDWDINELVEDLAEEEQGSNLWCDDAEKYFNAMEGDY